MRQGLLTKVRSDRQLGAPYVYSVTTKALRAAGYPSVEAMREVIGARFSPSERAGIANEFEKTRRRLTRGLRFGPGPAKDAAPGLPDPALTDGEAGP